MSLQQLFLATSQPICDAADFDGTNDYATRGADLTGMADSKLFTFVTWFSWGSAGVTNRIFTGVSLLAGVTPYFSVYCQTTNKLIVEARNAANSTICELTTSTSVNDDVWRCAMCSVDLADTAKRHLYLGDTNELNVTTYTNDTINFTLGDWAIGARADGGTKFNGGIAEVLFWPGVYVDFSVEANRRLFFSSAGQPSTFGPGTQAGNLGAPAVYLHLYEGETADNFVANNDAGATGGTFTVTGALTTYASSPSD